MNNLININCLNTSDEEIFKKSETVNPIITTSSNKVLKTHRFNDAKMKFLNTSSNLFRLNLKSTEYVYARADDIVVIESYDHLVKVYLGFGNTIKKTIRKNTLKDFLLLLPENQFMRIGRFCAVNMQRLSGGSCKNQTFEFDFNFSIKLTHPISNTVFTSIGK